MNKNCIQYFKEHNPNVISLHKLLNEGVLVCNIKF